MNKLIQEFNERLHEYKGICTMDIQLASLHSFMEGLGYTPITRRTTFKNVFGERHNKLELIQMGFEKRLFDSINKDNPNHLSFQEGCELHNSIATMFATDYVIMRNKYHFHIDAWNDAVTSKIVKAVKLQRKKGGNVIVQSNFVSFTTDGMYYESQ